MSLVTYTVHEQPVPSADRIDRATDLRFVKDGFSWVTALFPPFGLAAAQLWIPLVAYLGITAVGTALLAALGVDERWISLTVIAFNIFVAFEQSTLQRLTLDHAGYQMLGTVTGKDLDECERRFFENWLPGQPMVATGKGEAATQSVAPSWKSTWSGLAQKG